MFALYVEVIRVRIRREIKNRLATMLRGPACFNASRRRIGPLPGKVGNRATGHILSPLRAAQAAGVPSPEYIHLGCKIHSNLRGGRPPLKIPSRFQDYAPGILAGRWRRPSGMRNLMVKEESWDFWLNKIFI